MIAAKQYGDAVRIITTAHQIEAMARQKKLRELDSYLKRLKRQRPRKKVDQSEALAAMLERRAAKQKQKGE